MSRGMDRGAQRTTIRAKPGEYRTCLAIGQVGQVFRYSVIERQLATISQHLEWQAAVNSLLTEPIAKRVETPAIRGSEAVSIFPVSPCSSAKPYAFR
jgi:hypothetical protein